MPHGQDFHSFVCDVGSDVLYDMDAGESDVDPGNIRRGSTGQQRFAWYFSDSHVRRDVTTNIAMFLRTSIDDVAMSTFMSNDNSAWVLGLILMNIAMTLRTLRWT